MATQAVPTQYQYASLWNKYIETMEANRELETLLIEKDETIARLRRALNNSENKMARLEQIMDPEMFLATR